MHRILILLLWMAYASPVSADCGTQCQDQDNDGVVDTVDQCSDTEPGAPVTIHGCTHDTDGDGIPEYRDKCPNQAAVSVDPWGCPSATEIALPDVSFEVNSAALKASSHETLNDVVQILSQYDDLQAEIAGHTDDRGSAAHNRQLSRLRAEAVRKFLVDAGVGADQIVARGYGESRPIANNDTEQGRNRNRRVVLRILEGQLRNTES